MAFSKKTWKDRVSQYINRRLLTDSDGNTQQVTVTRDEGSVTEAGDAFSASNMNDLEDRIEAAIPVKIQDLDNVTLTTSDNNKLLGVSVSGSDISVGAVAKSSLVSYTEIDVAFDSSGEGTLFTTIKYVVGLVDVVGGAPYVGYMSFVSAPQVKVKNYGRSGVTFESVIKSATRKVGVYYLNI